MESTTLAEAMSECTKFSRRGLDFWVKQKCEMFYQNCGEQKFFMCLVPFPRIGDGKRNPITPSSCGSRLYRRGIMYSFISFIKAASDVLEQLELDLTFFYNFTDLSNVPTSRGCHIQFPSGCSSQKSPKYKQYQNKTAWSYYDWKGSSDSMENCYSKQKGLNDWCGIHDVVMIFNKGKYVIHNIKITEIFHKCFDNHRPFTIQLLIFSCESFGKV